jgi:DNA-binding CsgD family transcriptional regulator
VGRGKVDDPRRGHRVRPLRRGVADPSPKEDGLLSARELEVLRLVAEGLTDSQVAERLHVSPRTVGQHLRSIYRKLGVPTRAAAAKEAVERNLI